MDDLFNVDNDEEMLDENDGSDMDVDASQDPMLENDNDNTNDNDNDNDNDDIDDIDDNDDNDDNDGDNDGDNDDDGDEDNDDENDDDDIDNEAENENDMEDENENENEDDNDKDDRDQEPGSPKKEASQNDSNGANGSNGTSTASGANGAQSTEPTKVDRWSIRARATEQARQASEFDIVPMAAIPYVQQCHVVAISEGPKWLLTGGEDGFIRKYDFAASIDGKAPLTVAQKHNLMDNVTKAGVIGLYWENEQPMTKTQILNANPKFRDLDFTTGFAAYEPTINPVYSLDVEKNGYWCLLGLLSGGISLYTMIYNEGAMHHYFRHNLKKTEHLLDTGHSDAVSVLRLNYAQTSFLSGSWDKTIREWDLNTGKVLNLFRGNTGQISSIQYRPRGLVTDLTFTDASSDIDSLFGSDDDEAETSKASVRPKTKAVTDDKVFMSSSIDGAISIWDTRVSGHQAVLKVGVPDGLPPWSMTASWSNDGDKIYVGRRNSTVEEFSLRMPHANKSGTVLMPNVLRKLVFPKISGPVSALSILPNDNFILCGSNDNIRLYNLKLYDEFHLESTTLKKRATPFYVIPGHHGGVLSSLTVDETGRFMISASGNRGWGHSSYADVVLVYSIDADSEQSRTTT